MSLGGLKEARASLAPESIRSPAELRGRSTEELTAFAADVRRFLLESVSQTGGHIGANLGTVELSIALHAEFDSPHEPIVWDTGHQGYTHKIVTGRAHLFPTLNRYGGMNRFVSRSESAHDAIEASHAGTAVSVALGLALARRLDGDEGAVVAVVGDGALAEGMTLEALNHAAVERTRLVCVLNDNGYAISPGFGGLHEALRSAARSRALFEALGLAYIGPVDGHDLAALGAALRAARAAPRTPLVHVRTQKGHGWAPADGHPFRQHFSFPFEPATGAPRVPPPGPGYQDVAAAALAEVMAEDERVVCITPSTLYATGLAPVFAAFPERSFDPGMEEQHALTMTVGMALAGKKPVIAYQSTFLQRAFDQLYHDVCFANLPTLILAVRSGFAGYDNPTHHGIYDFAITRGLPNLKVLYPKDRWETARMVKDELRALAGPVLVCMPYGPADDLDPGVLEESAESFARPQLVRAGRDLMLFTVGHRFAAARAAVELLAQRGVDAGLVNLRRLKPLVARDLVPLLQAAPRAVSLEEAVLDGGVGGALGDLVHDRRVATELLRLGLPCRFVEPGSSAELARAYDLDAEGVLASILERWPELARERR